MLIDSVEIRDFRSLNSTGVLIFGPTTVIAGRNNAGKSSVIRAICSLQQGMATLPHDIRIGAQTADITVYPSPFLRRQLISQIDDRFSADESTVLQARWDRVGQSSVNVAWNEGQASTNVGQLPRERSRSVLVPVLSDRRTSTYERVVSRTNGRQVAINDRELTSRIVGLSSDTGHEGQRFREFCDRVLGLNITTFLEEDGQEPGVALSPDLGISISRMGHGVAATLKILSELASLRPRLYCVEEPETDLHPSALRELVQVMVESIEGGNQFLVSTHSSRVLQDLGSVPESRLYWAESKNDNAGVPTTTLIELTTHSERAELLADLGYEAAVPHGWLLMEESTAEQFVKSFFIPHFAPKLSALRTVSARGVDRLVRSADDFVRFALYAHLSAARERLWVLIDGDQAGLDVKAKLEPLSGASPIASGHVHLIGDGDLESCYPPRFFGQVARVRALKAEKKRDAKGALLRDVLAWCAADPAEAVREFGLSAARLIEALRIIEREYELLPDLPVS